MRKSAPRSRLPALIAGLLVGFLPIVVLRGQTPTAAQMQVFQSLPPDQQQGILQQMTGGQVGGAAVPNNGGSRRSSPEARRRLAGPESASAMREAAEDAAPLFPVIQPEDTVILQIKPRDSISANLLPPVKALADLILSRNPYKVDSNGRLLLPGVPPIGLAGLDDAQANQRLAVDPGLLDLEVRLIRMPLTKSGIASLTPFGYELFDRDVAAIDIQDADVPVPADYVMGAGDEIRVQLFGSQNRNFSLAVGRDGVVGFPELGPIHVGGLTFSAAKATIEARVAQQIIGVRANVSMGETRSIRVFVMGEAKRPGSYTISGLGTISSALYASGGIKRIGSLRDIQLKRQGLVVRHLDLYDLLIRGDTSDDAKLLPGDVIFIPPVGPTATVDGEVKRPAIYELRSEKDVSDLVALAGGLTSEGDASRSSLTRIDDQRRRIVLDVDLVKGKARTQRVRNGDILRIERLRPQLDAGVMVFGAVHRSGPAPWREGLRLTDVIGSMDELKQGADPHYILVRRESGPDRKIEVLSADLGVALRAPESEANLRLMSRDQLTVFELAPGRERVIKPLLEEIRLQSGLARPTEIVRVSGRVKVPGEYPLESKMRVSDLLRAGGNLDSAAFSGNAELARYEVSEGGARQSEVIEIDLAAILRGDRKADISLQPFDYLLIKEATDWSSQQAISLLGEVRFPGTYPIRRGETLHSVINRAGGLTAQAFTKGSVMTRVELREREQKQLDLLAERMQSDLTDLTLKASAVNQANAAQSLQAGQSLLAQLKQTKAVGRLVIDLPALVGSEVASANDVLLRDGDVLVIPKLRQEVTILGEVQSATSHLFAKGLTVNDYIRKSGGMTRKADKTKMYVVRADGSVVANDGSWFRRAPEIGVQPGDTIIVPMDTERMPALPLWQSVTQIFYNLTVALAAVKTF